MVLQLPYGSVKHDRAVRQTAFFLFSKRKFQSRIFLENKKENAPLAMGVPSHGKGNIKVFSLPLTARVSLAVTESEN